MNIIDTNSKYTSNVSSKRAQVIVRSNRARIWDADGRGEQPIHHALEGKGTVID